MTHWLKVPLVKIISVDAQEAAQVRKESVVCANLRKGQLAASPAASQMVLPLISVAFL